MVGDKIGDTIRWRMNIPAHVDEVYATINSDRGRASFWAESANEVDGYIEFKFINGYTYKSKVLERRAPFIFSIEYFGGPARFELTPDRKGCTDLMLTHDGVSPKNWIETHAGWLNVLFPLKAWVAHGIDLRNHDTERSWEQGYADQ